MNVRKSLLLVLVVCIVPAVHTLAIDEEEWLIEVSGLEPEERVARLRKELDAFTRKHCGLFLGAMLSKDEEISLLRPAIQRQARALVQPEDVDFLVDKLGSTEDPLQKDWLVDLLGFCGKPGFDGLKALYGGHGDPRIRIGALRAMANLGLPEALSYVVDATGKARSVPEREVGLFAEAQLRWRTGQIDLNKVFRASRPLVYPKDSPERIRSALTNGGTLVVPASEIPDGFHRILKDLGVEFPAEGAKGAPQHCVFSPSDFHRLLAYPFDFFCADVAEGTFADFSWARWQPDQLATLRLKDRPDRAAVVIQEGVLGHGRAVFSGISMHTVGSAASLGIADRDPWDENMSWFHADREIAQHLYLWQAKERFVSYHVPWAKPLTGGPIKAAIVTPAYNAREAVEFAQRLSLEYEHLPYNWAEQKAFAHGTEVGRLTPPCFEMLERTLAKPRDVVILSGRPVGGKTGPETYSLLPAAYQETLLRACRDQGIGLVIVGEPGPFLKLPEEAEKETLASPFTTIQRAQWGKGRVVSLERPGPEPAEFRTPGALRPIVRLDSYDHWASDVVAQIAWAARREAPLAISGRPSVQEGALQVSVRNRADQALQGTLGAVLRNTAGRIASEGRGDVQIAPKGDAQILIPVDGLSAGRFVAELVARNKDGASIGWGWSVIHVESGLEITDIRFDRPLYRLGEEMALEIVTKGKVPAGALAEAKVLDRYGRLCGRAEAELDPNAPKVRLAVGGPLWRYVYVIVSLKSGGKPVAHFEKPWIVDVPAPAKDFPYAAWSDLSRQESLTPMAHLAGIDWLNTDFERCLHNGILPWIIGFGGLGLGYHAPAMNYERNPSTLGPTFHQWRLNAIPPQMQEIIRAGVTALIDQDEESLGGEYDFHPAALHEFRKHLMVVHGSLERLNKVWGTEYKQWSEVIPMLLSQVRGRPSLAPMVELRLFMDTAYLHHVEFDRFVAESCGMENVRLGLSTCGGGFDDGWDIWKASQMLTCLIRQGPENREKFLSWARPDMVLGRWTGGYYPDNVVSGHFMPWHQLFHGSTVYATWCSGIGNYMSIWRADGGPRDGIAAAAEELRAIWTGPATLIRHSTRVPPQVGILYSRSSQMTSVVDWAGATWGSAWTIESLLEMMGHQYRWISYEELEQGFCDTWPGKCLFLPVSTCLSELEVAGIRRFVEKGGTVVADCDPGTRDGHGGAPGPGQLADVFGCEWVPAPALPNDQKPRLRLQVKGLPEEAELDHGYCRVAKVTAGKPNGVVQYANQDFPAWIQHSFGRGQAISLNFLPGKSGIGPGVISTLLEMAGVSHDVGVLKDGENMSAVERSSFQDGENRYMGIIHFVKLRPGWGELRLTADEEKPTPGVAIRFPAKTHLYDVRTGKYHGVADSLTLDLAPGHPYLFAQLPYKVETLAADSAGTASIKDTGRISVSVVTDGKEPSGHAIRLQVLDPTGRERTEYGTVRHFPAGKGEVDVPFAPNDPTGKWRMVVTDAATGVSTEKVWEVQP